MGFDGGGLMDSGGHKIRQTVFQQPQLNAQTRARLALSGLM